MLASPSTPSSSRDKVARHRARRRADGMRLVQFWVPDTRNPEVRAELARQARAVSEAPDFDDGMDWVERVSILDEELRRDRDA